MPNKESGNTLTEVPAFDWSYGCSATSAAMIAGYFDRTFFANMYVGPTNSSVVPMNNSAWGTGEMPLSATHQGLDGRAIKGHVDDYWIAYSSSANDPFYENWAEHTYGDALGDYMKTNQTTYFGNTDGETTFYTYTTYAGPLTCDDMEAFDIDQYDGAYGVKLFYESRGALRTLDDSNNLSDLSNSPSAQAKPIVPVTEGLYQQNNPNIRYTGVWQTWNDGQASGGSITYSNDTSASAALTFTGEQIRLIFTRYTSRGDVVIYIDDYDPFVFSQYGTALVYQNWLTIYGLPAGDHTIRFVHPGGIKYIDIDALQVFTVSTYSSSGIAEDGSLAIDANEGIQP